MRDNGKWVMRVMRRRIMGELRKMGRYKWRRRGRREDNGEIRGVL